MLYLQHSQHWLQLCSVLSAVYSSPSIVLPMHACPVMAQPRPQQKTPKIFHSYSCLFLSSFDTLSYRTNCFTQLKFSSLPGVQLYLIWIQGSVLKSEKCTKWTAGCSGGSPPELTLSQELSSLAVAQWIKDMPCVNYSTYFVMVRILFCYCILLCVSVCVCTHVHVC